MLEVDIGDLTTCTQLVDYCTVWLAAGKEIFTLIQESTEYIQQYLKVGICDLITCTQLMDFCTVWLAAGKAMFTLIQVFTEYIQQYVRGRHW